MKKDEFFREYLHQKQFDHWRTWSVPSYGENTRRLTQYSGVIHLSQRSFPTTLARLQRTKITASMTAPERLGLWAKISAEDLGRNGM